MKYACFVYLCSLIIRFNTIIISKNVGLNSKGIVNMRSNRDSCLPSQFLCKDLMKCIDLQLVCNQKSDCDDESDETMAACYWYFSTTKICQDYEFKCHNNTKCVSKRKVCDGINNCLDKSDELSCAYNENKCDKLCYFSQKCIRLEDICNNIIDCPEKDDESYCNVECLPHQYKCGNSSQCINAFSVCDGFFDCRNMDDEKDCSKLSYSTNADRSYVIPCWRNGTVCTCLQGYKLFNMSHCEDINECEESVPVCAQECINTAGSFVCTCTDHFEVMKNDSTKCVAETSKELIFYTTPFGIKYQSIVNEVSGSFLFPASVTSQPHYFFALDTVVIDWTHEIVLFWSDIQTGCVMRSHFSNLSYRANNAEIIYSNTGSYITQIVFDRRFKNLYWFDEAETSLSAMNLAAKSRTIILDHKSIYSMYSLTLHNKQSKLFWIDLNNDNGKIVVSSLNGKHCDIIIENRVQLSALTIDEESNVLYWMERGQKLMTTSIKQPLKNLKMVVKTSIGDPFGVAFTKGEYVYSDMSSKGKVYMIDVLQPVKLRYHVHMQWAITVKNAKQFSANGNSDLCDNNKCSQHCLPDILNRTYTCHCSPQYHISFDGYNCQLNGNKSVIHKVTVTAKSREDQSRRNHFKYKTALVVIVCLTCFILFCIFLYKCCMVDTHVSNQIDIIYVSEDYEVSEFENVPLVESSDKDMTALLDDSMMDTRIP